MKPKILYRSDDGWEFHLNKNGSYSMLVDGRKQKREYSYLCLINKNFTPDKSKCNISPEMRRGYKGCGEAEECGNYS